SFAAAGVGLRCFQGVTGCHSESGPSFHDRPILPPAERRRMGLFRRNAPHWLKRRAAAAGVTEKRPLWNGSVVCCPTPPRARDDCRHVESTLLSPLPGFLRMPI